MQLEISNLDEIERKLYAEGLKENAKVLREIINTRKRLARPAAPVRTILEHASLLI